MRVPNPSLRPEHTCFNNTSLIPVSLELGRAQEGGSLILCQILTCTKAFAVGSGTKSVALSSPLQLRASWWIDLLSKEQKGISFSFVVCTMENS